MHVLRNEEVEDETEQTRGASAHILYNLQESSHLAASLRPDPLEVSAGTAAPTNPNSALAGQPQVRLPTVKKKQEVPTMLENRGSTSGPVMKKIQLKPRLEISGKPLMQ